MSQYWTASILTLACHAAPVFHHDDMALLTRGLTGTVSYAWPCVLNIQPRHRQM